MNSTLGSVVPLAMFCHTGCPKKVTSLSQEFFRRFLQRLKGIKNSQIMSMQKIFPHHSIMLGGFGLQQQNWFVSSYSTIEICLQNLQNLNMYFTTKWQQDICQSVTQLLS